MDHGTERPSVTDIPYHDARPRSPHVNAVQIPSLSVQRACSLLSPVCQQADPASEQKENFWKLYFLSIAATSDKLLMESWQGDTDGILIFVRSLVTPHGVRPLTRAE